MQQEMTATLSGPSVRGFVIGLLSVLAFIWSLCLFVLLFSTSDTVSNLLVLAMFMSGIGIAGGIYGEIAIHKRRLTIDEKGIHYNSYLSTRSYPWAQIKRIHKSQGRALFGGLDFFWREQAFSLRLLMASGAFTDLEIYYEQSKETEKAVADVDAAILKYHPTGYSPYIDKLHGYQWALLVIMIVTLVYAVYYILVNKRAEMKSMLSVFS